MRWQIHQLLKKEKKRWKEPFQRYIHSVVQTQEIMTAGQMCLLQNKKSTQETVKKRLSEEGRSQDYKQDHWSGVTVKIKKKRDPPGNETVEREGASEGGCLSIQNK